MRCGNAVASNGQALPRTILSLRGPSSAGVVLRDAGLGVVITLSKDDVPLSVVTLSLPVRGRLRVVSDRSDAYILAVRELEWRNVRSAHTKYRREPE